MNTSFDEEYDDEEDDFDDMPQPSDSKDTLLSNGVDLKYFKSLSMADLPDTLTQCGIAHPDVHLGYHHQMVTCLHPDHHDKNPSMKVEWNVTALESKIKLSCWPCTAATRSFSGVYESIGVDATYQIGDAYIYKSASDDLLGCKTVPRVYDQDTNQQVRKERPKWRYPTFDDYDNRYKWVYKKTWLKLNPNRNLPVPLLYNLQEVANGSDVIYIPEGEKDVELLKSWGYLATCEPHGAGSWKPEYNQLLEKYATINLLIDNDSAGIGRKVSVGEELLKLGKAVNYFQFDSKPEHYDIGDWASEGHTKNDFEEEVIPYFKPLTEAMIEETKRELAACKGVGVGNNCGISIEELLKELKNKYFYLTDHGESYLTTVTNNHQGLIISRHNPSSLKGSRYAGREIYVEELDKSGNVSTKPVNVIDYWNKPFKYKHKLGPSDYSRIDFDPTPHPERGIYNLWTGFPFDPLYDEDVSDFIDFVSHHLCNDEMDVLYHVLSYIAHLFQKPGKLPMTALVFQSVKGTGKSMLFAIIRHLLGKYAVVVNKWEQLTGRFAGLVTNKLLVVVDDAAWGGYKEGVGFLNNLITSDTIGIEFKGKDTINIKNYARVVVLGNDEWLVQKTSDDRRYYVIKPSGEHINPDKSFYEDLYYKYREPVNSRKLMGFFLKYDLSGWKPEEAVRARAVGHEMGLQELTSLEKFLFWCASNKSLVFPNYFQVQARATGTRLNEIEEHRSRMWPARLRFGKDFYSSYKEWIKSEGLKDGVTDDTRFSKLVKPILGIDSKDKSQVIKSSEGLSIWITPSIEEFRLKLTKKYKLPEDYFDE